MDSDDRREQLRKFALGLAVLFVPALIILTTLEFLILTGDLVFSDLSVIELLELYLIELVVFAGGAYLLYRLLLATMPDTPDDDAEHTHRE